MQVIGKVRTKKSISVIIPAYNAERTIDRCLKSILSQSFLDFDVYVVNDGSTDNTKNVLKKYTTYPNIFIFNKNNGGVSNARNYALKFVDSQFVVFVDSDDYVEKDYLKHLIEAICDKKYDMAITGINTIKSGHIVNKTNYKEGIYSAEDMLTEILNQNGPQGYLWNKIFKLSIIKKYNLKFNSDISMAEDLLFCVKYLIHSNCVSILNNIDYNYVKDGEGLAYTASLYNKNKNYREAYEDYIKSLKLINKIIPREYKNTCFFAKARLGKVYSEFLRIMLLNKCDDKCLYIKVRGLALQNKRYVYNTKKLKNKEKISFFLVIYFPKIMYFLDKKRFR